MGIAVTAVVSLVASLGKLAHALTSARQAKKKAKREQEEAAREALKNLAASLREMFEDAYDVVYNLLSDLGFEFFQTREPSTQTLETIEVVHTGADPLAPPPPGVELDTSRLQVQTAQNVALPEGARITRLEPPFLLLKDPKRWTKTDRARAVEMVNRLKIIMEQNPDLARKLYPTYMRLHQALTGGAELSGWWKKLRKKMKKAFKKVEKAVRNVAKYAAPALYQIAHHQTLVKRSARRWKALELQKYTPEEVKLSLLAKTNGYFIGRPAQINWDYVAQRVQALKEAITTGYEGQPLSMAIEELENLGVKSAWGRSSKEKEVRQKIIRAWADICRWNLRVVEGLVNYAEKIIDIVLRGKVPVFYKLTAYIVPPEGEEGQKRVGMLVPVVRKEADEMKGASWVGAVCPVVYLPVVEAKDVEQAMQQVSQDIEQGGTADVVLTQHVYGGEWAAQGAAVISSDLPAEETPETLAYYDPEAAGYVDYGTFLSKIPKWIWLVAGGGAAAIALFFILRRKRE